MGLRFVDVIFSTLFFIFFKRIFLVSDAEPILSSK
jgi:hypothetical protein